MVVQKQLKSNYNIKLSMDYSWISNGPRIQEDLAKIIKEKNKVKEKEVDQDKTDGSAMIVGVEDHLQMKEALLVIAEIRI